MTGGKIVITGTVEEVMPTFTIDSVKPKVKIDDTTSVAGPFYVFSATYQNAAQAKSSFPKLTTRK